MGFLSMRAFLSDDYEIFYILYQTAPVLLFCVFWAMHPWAYALFYCPDVHLYGTPILSLHTTDYRLSSTAAELSSVTGPYRNRRMISVFYLPGVLGYLFQSKRTWGHSACRLPIKMRFIKCRLMYVRSLAKTHVWFRSCVVLKWRYIGCCHPLTTVVSMSTWIRRWIACLCRCMLYRNLESDDHKVHAWYHFEDLPNYADGFNIATGNSQSNESIALCLRCKSDECNQINIIRATWIKLHRSMTRKVQ